MRCRWMMIRGWHIWSLWRLGEGTGANIKRWYFANQVWLAWGCLDGFFVLDVVTHWLWFMVLVDRARKCFTQEIPIVSLGHRSSTASYVIFKLYNQLDCPLESRSVSLGLADVDLAFKKPNPNLWRDTNSGHKRALSINSSYDLRSCLESGVLCWRMLALILNVTLPPRTSHLMRGWHLMWCFPSNIFSP